MSRHEVRIRSDDGPGHQALVDGVDIARCLAGLTLRMGVNEVPQLELELLLIDVSEVGSVQADVLLDSASHDALVALGWTPPADGEQ